MDGRQKWFFVFFLIGMVILLVVWLGLPRIADVLPGQIRGRLPDEILLLITTPLPTALPEPLQPADVSILDVSVPTIPNANPSSTLAATATQQTAATGIEEAHVATLAPSGTLPPKPTETPTLMPSPTTIPSPDMVRLAGLKVTPQKYNNCGPANLSIVLNYYGHKANQLEIGESLKPNYEDRNVSPHELVSYVTEETGLLAKEVYGLSLEDLKRLLAADFPVIIEKGLLLDATHGWMGHYLTLFGYDEEEEVFYGLDTFLGPWDSTGRTFEYLALDELWAQFNRVAIIVFPSGLTDELAMILGSHGEVDEVMWQATVDRARVALEADADDAFAWFDLAGGLYHQATLTGDDALYLQSAAAFDRAREIGLPWRTLWYQFEPYQAYLAAGRFDEVLALTEAVMTTSGGRNIEETYLFRGHALLASGDLVGAERAYAQALRLNPGLDVARKALQSLPEPAESDSG